MVFNKEIFTFKIKSIKEKVENSNFRNIIRDIIN